MFVRILDERERWNVNKLKALTLTPVIAEGKQGTSEEFIAYSCKRSY